MSKLIYFIVATYLFVTYTNGRSDGGENIVALLVYAAALYFGFKMLKKHDPIKASTGNDTRLAEISNHPAMQELAKVVERHAMQNSPHRITIYCPYFDPQRDDYEARVVFETPFYNSNELWNSHAKETFYLNQQEFKGKDRSYYGKALQQYVYSQIPLNKRPPYQMSEKAEKIYRKGTLREYVADYDYIYILQTVSYMEYENQQEIKKYNDDHLRQRKY